LVSVTLEAERVDLPDVVAKLAVDVGAGLVGAVAEVGVPGGTVGSRSVSVCHR
jgi:hypothetical protein